MPEEQTLHTVLGMGPEESFDAHTAEQLAPLAQQMLATMAMLGMQRIVIDGGSIVRRCAFTSTRAAPGTRTRGALSIFRTGRRRAAASAPAPGASVPRSRGGVEPVYRDIRAILASHASDECFFQCVTLQVTGARRRKYIAS